MLLQNIIFKKFNIMDLKYKHNLYSSSEELETLEESGKRSHFEGV